MNKELHDHAKCVLGKLTKGWCDGVFAENEQGVPVHPASPEAVCFCARGASYACAGATSDQVGVFHTLFGEIVEAELPIHYEFIKWIESKGIINVAQWSNESGQAKVVADLTRFIDEDPVE